MLGGRLRRRQVIALRARTLYYVTWNASRFKPAVFSLGRADLGIFASTSNIISAAEHSHYRLPPFWCGSIIHRTAQSVAPSCNWLLTTFVGKYTCLSGVSLSSPVVHHGSCETSSCQTIHTKRATVYPPGSICAWNTTSHLIYPTFR